MKHSLVTGGAGFIGSHLVDLLLARGDRVSVIDDESTGSVNNLNAAMRHPRFKYAKGTVADRQLVRRMLVDVEEVYHMAAAVGTGLIASAPVRVIETNVYPVELIVEEVNRVHQKGRPIKLFLASSSEVYGRSSRSQWSESDNLVIGPTANCCWAGGAAKAIGEFLALAYWRQRDLPVVVGRLFNVSGPRQNGESGMVLPRFVEAALAGGPLVVYNDGRQLRCFAHVKDVVRAIVDLMGVEGTAGKVFNIGSDQPISILRLAHRIISRFEPGISIKFRKYADVYGENFQDCPRRVPDLGELCKTINYKPRYGLNEIIDEVIAWHRGEEG